MVEPSSRLDALIAERIASRTKGPTCGVAVALATLPPIEAQALVENIARPKEIVQNADIAIGLKGLGMNISADTIGRHRRGSCQCR